VEGERISDSRVHRGFSLWLFLALLSTVVGAFCCPCAIKLELNPNRVSSWAQFWGVVNEPLSAPRTKAVNPAISPRKLLTAVAPIDKHFYLFFSASLIVSSRLDPRTREQKITKHKKFIMHKLFIEQSFEIIIMCRAKKLLGPAKWKMTAQDDDGICCFFGKFWDGS
jgi:hypothetical protein